MRQVQKVENYLCLEGRVQRRNKWMPQNKDQSLFFSVTVEDTLQQMIMWDFFMTLMGKALVRSSRCFHLRQYHFSESFAQNSDWVKTVYRNFQLTSSSTCLSVTFSFLQTGQNQPLLSNVDHCQKPQHKSCISG